MPINWKLYRAVCLLQIVLTTIVLFHSLLYFFESPGFGTISRLIVFLLSLLLATFTLHLINNNYPDNPVAGRQKKTFNRLFLLNFMALAFLFGFIFAEVQLISSALALTTLPAYRLPFLFLAPVVSYSMILLLQLVILYGLYDLRRQLDMNFRKKKFDFE
ncbi:MAG: hypothetical protein ABW019_10735 [Chitinophagaceae bacterium]